MKAPANLTRNRRQTGMLLIECLVYMSVLVVLLGIGTAAFYFCWDHTRAVISATDEIAAALRAGEGWRADVRSATGKIGVETTATGELVRIPEAAGAVIYRFEAGEVRREIPALNHSRLVLPKVKDSQMIADPRGSVSAWRWELELGERIRETHLPLQFTFEAAQPTP